MDLTEEEDKKLRAVERELRGVVAWARSRGVPLRSLEWGIDVRSGCDVRLEYERQVRIDACGVCLLSALYLREVEKGSISHETKCPMISVEIMGVAGEYLDLSKEEILSIVEAWDDPSCTLPYAPFERELAQVSKTLVDEVASYERRSKGSSSAE